MAIGEQGFVTENHSPIQPQAVAPANGNLDRQLPIQTDLGVDFGNVQHEADQPEQPISLAMLVLEKDGFTDHQAFTALDQGHRPLNDRRARLDGLLDHRPLADDVPIVETERALVARQRINEIELRSVAHSDVADGRVSAHQHLRDFAEFVRCNAIVRDNLGRHAAHPGHRHSQGPLQPEPYLLQLVFHLGALGMALRQALALVRHHDDEAGGGRHDSRQPIGRRPRQPHPLRRPGNRHASRIAPASPLPTCPARQQEPGNDSRQKADDNAKDIDQDRPVIGILAVENKGRMHDDGPTMAGERHEPPRQQKRFSPAGNHRIDIVVIMIHDLIGADAVAVEYDDVEITAVQHEATADQAFHEVRHAERRADPTFQILPSLLDGVVRGVVPIDRGIQQEPGLGIGLGLLNQPDLARHRDAVLVACRFHRRPANRFRVGVVAERPEIAARERLDIGDRGIPIPVAGRMDGEIGKPLPPDPLEIAGLFLAFDGLGIGYGLNSGDVPLYAERLHVFAPFTAADHLINRKQSATAPHDLPVILQALAYPLENVLRPGRKLAVESVVRQLPLTDIEDMGYQQTESQNNSRKSMKE